MFVIGDDSRAALQDRHHGSEAGQGLPQFQRYRPPADGARFNAAHPASQFSRSNGGPHPGAVMSRRVSTLAR
jgi:hypothetical protein